jgi:uncharacterized protein (DUF1778 family)
MPRMRITPYVQAVRDDLLAVASVGQREGEELIGRLAGALESSLRLRLLEAVTEAAQELSSHIQSGHIEVRLAGSDPTLAFVEEVAEPAAPVGDDLSARITLRLPDSLKSRIDTAASAEGVSVNTWLVQAISRSIESRPPRTHGRRLSGYARS